MLTKAFTHRFDVHSHLSVNLRLSYIPCLPCLYSKCGWLSNDSAVAITKSSKKDRLKGMLAAGDLHLSHRDVEAIDRAGRQHAQKESRKKTAKEAGKWVTVVCLAGVVAWRMITAV